MSLDVYLYDKAAKPKPPDSGIFVRENGSTREITREEWDAAHPGLEPVRWNPDYDPDPDYVPSVFDANITHNLNRMASEAGIYEAMWRPEEIGATHARDIIEPLAAGLSLLLTDSARFKKHNPENGWGSYEVLVDFVRGYLEACRAHPDSEIRVSR